LNEREAIAAKNDPLGILGACTRGTFGLEMGDLTFDVFGRHTRAKNLGAELVEVHP
jgi:hypothetical protein